MEETLGTGRALDKTSTGRDAHGRWSPTEREERIFVASQWQLMWWGFRRHRLAVVALFVIAALYGMAIFATGIAPYGPLQRTNYSLAAPQRVRFIDGDGRFHLRPFVYALERSRDPETLAFTYVEDASRQFRLVLFPKGEPYKFLGGFRADIRLFGVEGEGTIFLLGTDKLGRDMLSRILSGARISLSIGLIGVIINLFIGTMVGSISGLYSGLLDLALQRVIEVLISIPKVPFWMAMSAAIPQDWSPVNRYFAIIIVLSLVGWTSTARIVRSKFISTREEDFVMAAKLSGANQWRIIFRHLIPTFASYLIVKATLEIPGMIIGETALSFLGLGLQPPTISWGVLLQQAQNVQAIASQPWLLSPAIFIFVAVLMFNFMGDGLRDAADPYR